MPNSGLIPSTVLQRLKLSTNALHIRLDLNLAVGRTNAGIGEYLEHSHLINLWLNEVNTKLIFRREYVIKQAYALNQYFLDLIFIDFKASSRMTDFLEGPLEVRFKPEISLPFFWGIDYVVKGSALGAGHLYKTLSLTLPEHPLFYFDEAATHGMDRWDEFSLAIEAAITNEFDMKAAERGAVWAFEQIIALNLQMQPLAKTIRPL